MIRKPTKDNIFFDFTTKVLNSPNHSKGLKQPLPPNIHHLLATFIQFCSYVGIFPYRLRLERGTGQYEIRSHIFQKAIFGIMWIMNITHFCITETYHMGRTKISNILDVLLLLSGASHFANQMMFLYVIIKNRQKIKNLLNFFVACNNVSTSDISGNKSFTSKILKYIGFMTWLATFLGCFRGTEIIQQYLIKGIKPLSHEDLEDFELVHIFSSLQTNEVSSNQFLYYLKQSVIILIVISTYVQKFLGIFMLGLEIAVALTMKFISSHVVSELESSSALLPSSDKLETAFSILLVVRHVYRLLNQIFGWLFFFTIMGEFPNLTFFLVFEYMSPDAPLQESFKFSLIFESILLTIATWAVLQLSQVKDKLSLEDKQHWQASCKGSLQKRIIMFELSLNRYALYAHGFFQLSLPAFVTIAAGILSNTLMIIQVFMTKAPSSE